MSQSCIRSGGVHVSVSCLGFANYRMAFHDRFHADFGALYRTAAAVLKEQDDRTKQNDGAMVQNLHHVKELGQRSLAAIESGNLTDLGHLMHEHWQFKKQRSKLMSNPDIDKWYDLARDNGAIGGKLIGAGGGGFLLFYTEQKGRLRQQQPNE